MGGQVGMLKASMARDGVWRGLSPSPRGWGIGKGLCPSPENFQNLFLKMVHFGAILYALNNV